MVTIRLSDKAAKLVKEMLEAMLADDEVLFECIELDEVEGQLELLAAKEWLLLALDGSKEDADTWIKARQAELAEEWEDGSEE